MKKLLTVLLIVLLVVVLAVGAYVAYVFLDYSRIEDHQALEITQRTQGELPQGQALKITSWNVGFGAYSDDYSFFMDGGSESRAYSADAARGNIQYAIDFIAAEDADLMLFQEVDFDSTRSYHVDERAMIEDAFAQRFSSDFAVNYHSSYLLYPILKPHGASNSGILTLSSARIDAAERRSLPIEGGFRKFLDLDRCYSVSRIPVSGGRTLCLFNLHLSAYTADGSIATQQLELLLQDMQQERDAGNYVIAGGDFNKDIWGDSGAIMGVPGQNYSWAQPFPTALLPEGFTLVDSLDAAHPVASCRDTGAPYVKGETYEVTLDAFIVSDNISVQRCAVLDSGFKSTDHNPIMMEFVLE